MGRAVALLFTGLTAANVLGVPFGTFLGQQYGWRSTFWVISVIGVVSFVGVVALVPKLAEVGEAPSLRREPSVSRSGQVWLLSLIVTVLAYGGMFGAFTYIAYTLTEVSGFAEPSVPLLLVLFGLGLFVGNWAGGRYADRSIDLTLIVFISALIVVLTAFALLAASKPATVVALFLMGGFGFGTVPARRVGRWTDDQRRARLHLSRLGRGADHRPRADRADHRHPHGPIR